ncbi:MAG TPA: DAK2 domain-containing protein [Lapillicoccus sp.]|nr:DAK2 domain-containing protein [Lapillicoccus sp.]
MTGSDVRGDVLSRLDTGAARRWAVVTRAAFAARRAEIDALNVFPVPDGDTGTNLYLTFDAALDTARVEYEDRTRRGHPVSDEDLATEADVFARALLLTARGNSGVILSQIFRGFADEAAATGVSGIGAQGLAAAMTRADELAWSSVAHPVEGTILSVSRAAAAAATSSAAEHGDDLYAVSTAALEAAREALARTPAQLPRLAQAGVVDAGGAGYVLLLESLERVVTGDVGVESFAGDDPLRRRPGWTQPVVHPRPGDLEPGGPAYEVMFLLSDASDEAVEVLKQRLDALGDSLLVVGTGDLHNVHVHVDDVGAAIEAGIEAGRPHRIKVTHFRDQVATHPDQDIQAVVTAAAGEGLAGTFRAAGASVVSSGPRWRANAAQFLEAARSTGAGQVILLPNDGDTLLAANAAAKVAAEEGIDLRVVHARTAVQGIAALAVYDPDRPLADNVLEMSSAAAATRNGAVTVATKEALTSGGPCRPGDVLGVVDGDIVIVGDDLTRVGAEVVERLLSSGGELLTVVAGEDATPALGQDVADAVRAHRRDLEVTHIYGGQPLYPLLLGVE